MSASLPQKPSSDLDRLSWLQLIRTSGIGPIGFWKLLEKHKTAQEALSFLKWEIKGGKQYCLSSLEEVEKERELHEKIKAQLVYWGEDLYPQTLHNLEDRPPVLSIKGLPLKKGSPFISIVGARNASLNGKYFAQKLAQELGNRGVIIVSGLARGIDTAAHRGSLSSGTVGIIAGGIDNIYPIENKNLYQEISERGTLLSETKIGTPPQASHFPRRNRLISGMSQGIALIEAGLNSGSMITAQFALSQGREIFATPGFPLDPRSQGCNRLLQEGAQVLTSAEDILDFLAQSSIPLPLPLPKEEKTPLFHPPLLPSDEEALPPLESYILESLESTPLSIDSLIRGSSTSTPQILQAISQLELSGKIHRLSGNLISRLWTS
jgi:DNA processing protein